MKRQDPLELRLLRVFLPLIIYYGLQLLTMIGLGCFGAGRQFSKMHADGGVNYRTTYRFADELQTYMEHHGLVVNLIAGIITIVILLLLFRKDLKQQGIEMTAPEQISSIRMLLTIGIGISVAAGLNRFFSLFPLDHILGDYSQVLKNFKSNPKVVQLLALCVVTPLTEELIFRGMMYRRMKDYTEPLTAAVLTSLAFGFYHGNLLQGLYAGCLSMILCYCYERSATMTVPVILHMTANAASLAMTYLPFSSWIGKHTVPGIFVMIGELGILLFGLYCFRLNTKKEDFSEKIY